MRSVFIIAALLGVMLAACCGTVDSYDPRTPAFRRSSLTITAVPNRAIPDTPIVITTKGAALVSGKGRIGFYCYHTEPDGILYLDAPATSMFLYKDTIERVLERTWHSYEFETNREFAVDWRAHVNRSGQYYINAIVQMDSLYVSDKAKFYGVLDSVVVNRSPGGHGYDWRMDLGEIWLNK